MNPLHILLVDDSKPDLLLLEMAFSERAVQHQIDTAMDGESAINFLKKLAEDDYKTIPDLILLDINMPGMSGHDVLDVIKHDVQLKHIPIIMLSTSSAHGDVLTSYQKYANCYIVKPANFEEYDNVINSVENFWMTTAKLPREKKTNK